MSVEILKNKESHYDEEVKIKRENRRVYYRGPHDKFRAEMLSYWVIVILTLGQFYIYIIYNI